MKSFQIQIDIFFNNGNKSFHYNIQLRILEATNLSYVLLYQDRILKQLNRVINDGFLDRNDRIRFKQHGPMYLKAM